MTAAEYNLTCERVIAVAGVTATLELADVDALIAQAETAQAVGPILDPTLARAGAEKLDQELKLFRALRTFRAVLEEFRP